MMDESEVRAQDAFERGQQRRLAEHQANQAAVKAATAVLLDAVLGAIQADPHQWSDRPCPTCRAVGSVIGKPFGCYVYAQQQRAKAKSHA